MWKVAIGLCVPLLISAETRLVCLEDRVGLNTFARQAFELELRKLVPQQRLAFTSTPCPIPAISIVISTHPPSRYARALGLTPTKDERVFPELHVFTQSVLRLLGEQVSAAQLGRALARVAAHEMGHYVFQRFQHDDEGLMRAGFETSRLAAEDPAPFRLEAR